MGDLTRNLSRSEFACRCGCGFDTVDIELPAAIQLAASHFLVSSRADKVVVNITGPNRCTEKNAKEGGASRSQHLFGRAADHNIELVFGDSKARVPTDELADFYEKKLKPDGWGVGRYDNGRVHLDTRTGCARWDVRSSG